MPCGIELCQHWFYSAQVIDPSHKSQNASVPYPTMQHFVTEMCTCVHISVTKWCIVGYLSDALWDLWNGSITILPTLWCICNNLLQHIYILRERCPGLVRKNNHFALNMMPLCFPIYCITGIFHQYPLEIYYRLIIFAEYDIMEFPQDFNLLWPSDDTDLGQNWLR